LKISQINIANRWEEVGYLRTIKKSQTWVKWD